MERITQLGSEYSILQQRLKYAKTCVDKPVTVFVENVPEWPESLLEVIKPDEATLTSYADSNGSVDLINTICQREEQTYKIQLREENVLITNGALHALSLIFRSIYQPGAIALCHAPVFASIPALLKDCGYNVSLFSTEHGDINISMLSEKCISNVRLIYVNFPHNPTGEVCSEEVIQGLVKLAEEKKIYLLLDSVYDSFIFEGRQLYSPFIFNSNWQYLYTVNSMSKNFGVPGLRIGWIVSDKKNIQQLAGRTERECVAICYPAQQQAINLLKLGNKSLVESVDFGRNFVSKYLSSLKNVDFSIPIGGTQLFAKFPVQDIELFADYMLIEYGLILTTASNYIGVNGSYVRIPTGYSYKTTSYALDLLKEGLDRVNDMKLI